MIHDPIAASQSCTTHSSTWSGCKMKLHSYKQVALKEFEFIQAPNLYLKGCSFAVQNHTPSQTQWKNFHESPKAKLICLRLQQCDMHCAACAFCSAQQKVEGRNANHGG